jgi:hypothetical protein
LHMSHMTYHSMHIHYCTFYDWHWLISIN